jgi:hypothetical protein
MMTERLQLAYSPTGRISVTYNQVVHCVTTTSWSVIKILFYR